MTVMMPVVFLRAKCILHFFILISTSKDTEIKLSFSTPDSGCFSRDAFGEKHQKKAQCWLLNILKNDLCEALVSLPQRCVMGVKEIITSSQESCFKHSSSQFFRLCKFSVFWWSSWWIIAAIVFMALPKLTNKSEFNILKQSIFYMTSSYEGSMNM